MIFSKTSECSKFNEREKIKGRSRRLINFTSMGWRNNLDTASLIVFNEHGRKVEYTRYRFHFCNPEYENEK